MSKFYSPLRYPGGKNCIFPFISNVFYENNLLGVNYAEPYAGGAGLALRLLFEGYVDKIYINDLDRSIYSFWKIILNCNDDFCKWIDEAEISIDAWKKYREIQINKENFDEFELAKSTFFLNRTNISGIIKGGPIGGHTQKGKYKINVRFNKNDLIERIEKIKTVSNRIEISNLDGIKFLNKINNKKENIFVYLDPPYINKGSNLYMNFYSDKDHENLSSAVKKIKKEWIVSYDNSEYILQLYGLKRKIIYQLSQSASNRVGDEILIFSDSIEYENSINLLKSPEYCLD